MKHHQLSREESLLNQRQRTNLGLPINLYYWRDKTGHEIDIIIDDAGKLTPVEIKSGKTISTEFFKHLKYWNNLSGSKKSLLLYAGNEGQKRSDGVEIKNWREL